MEKKTILTRHLVFVLAFISSFIAITALDSQNVQKEMVQGIIAPQQSGKSGTLVKENISLKPEAFKTDDGKNGWKIHIPENRPLPTPCIWNGLVFTGGGFGSYEFYCIDAKTGKPVWQFHTGDDGPTAAVADKGYVVFNTESCIIYVLKAKTGEVVWEKWLGDPLMSQPAIADGWVYMAYPGQDGHHYLACMGLESGKVRWKTKIIGDLISAPIIYEDAVYITTLEGTIYRYETKDGALAWSEKRNGTCAPWVYDDKIYVSLREEREGKTPDSMKDQYEGFANLDTKDGKQLNEDLWTPQKADYLSYETSSRYAEEQKALDASVGFGSAPGAAKLGQAKGNIGLSTVSGVWAYQGSRPAVFKGKNYNAMGDVLRAIDAESGEVLWEEKYKYKDENIGGRPLTPPSVVNGKLFIGSIEGDLLCYDAKTGKVLWKHNVAEPIRFQPAVSNGRVYFATDYGNIYCIETGDSKDDGWNMWGGNSSHNGLVE